MISDGKIQNNVEKTADYSRESFIAAAAKMADASNVKQWCCVAIDIRRFKIFRSWFGEEKGQYVLTRIAEMLHRLEENGNVVAAHFGHDSFALIMPHNQGEIEKIYTGVKNSISAYTSTIGFLPVFGVCLADRKAISSDILDKALIAVDDAKKTYTERIRYFDSMAGRNSEKEFDLMRELRTAMEMDEICFFVQPQCMLTTGQIVGGEALVRWIKKDGSIVSPGMYIPFLENGGFITELDKLVWEKVCRWLRQLLDRGIIPVPVSVNVSKVDMISMDVAAYFYSLTQRYCVPEALLKIEITESAYVENNEVISLGIDELRRKGFKVYMDDFGSGYSSLNMLDKVNVDVLKLDMAFMQKDTSLSRKGISIVESVISMTKALEIPVVIEGVETEEHRDFLTNMGCRYAQGYYFYRPVSTTEFEALISKEENVDYTGIVCRVTDLFHAREFLTENLFTDSALNNVLGAVAFYSLEGKDLAINRFNEPFYRAIGDASMNSRRIAIQNYVVPEDRHMLYAALETAENNIYDGGSCEVRFYKSDNSVFWFHMRFLFLKDDCGRKLYYGKVEDVTEQREQSIRFFEVLRKQADVTMKMDLDRNLIQYIVGDNTLYQVDLPGIDLDVSVRMTAEKRIETAEQRLAFIDFFNPERLKAQYRKAVYHETLNIDFKLRERFEPVEFSTYYIRHSKEQNLTVYAFAKKRDRELLERDTLTGARSRYAYNEALRLYTERGASVKNLIIFSLDVDGLKHVNDAAGHEAGDEMLRGAAECINRVFSPYGNCYRVGGDEFVVLAYGSKKLAEVLKAELERELAAWSGKQVESVSVSMGYVASDDDPEMSIGEMLKLADRKMYQAKSLYYSKRGIDRRLQQAAYNVMCSTYAKILKVSLTEDSFEIIRAETDELDRCRGYNERISLWFKDFAGSGQVHPDDYPRFICHTDLDYLRKFFRDGNEHFTMHYRRRYRNEYVMVIMEMLPAPEYSEEHQTVFLYVKEIMAGDSTIQ